MTFVVPELKYEYDALEPFISREIMELHYSKHHQGYVDKLNIALKDLSGYEDKSIESILKNLDEVPENVRTAVRNNGGGHYNHSLFWATLTPNQQAPSSNLEELIKQKYDSLENFKEEFTKAALGIFGSGWAWLMPDLSIKTSPNQDSPLMSEGVEPVLGLDVWEHAYYLDYKNKRPDYVAAWWNVVNWQQVEDSINNTK